MNRSVPDWLAEFQARFGEAIRAPLERASGTLTANTTAYDSRLTEKTSADRIAVYNRQYWFRLFDVMQNAFPLTARLIGFWEFNDYAAKFFLAHAPRSWDLDDAPNGFDDFFCATLARSNADEQLALMESARIDAAWRAISKAPESPPFRPSQDDAKHLPTSHLTPSPAVAFVREHFPLSEIRKKILDDPNVAVSFPPRLARERCFALARTDRGTLQIALKPLEMKLFEHLGELTVEKALAKLEQECTPEERATLPAQTRQWLAHGVENHFWIGLSRR